MCQNRNCALCFLQVFNCFPKEFLIGTIEFVEEVMSGYCVVILLYAWAVAF